jgi:hypothetical protein
MQVCLVESKIVVGEKAFKSRINFYIVVVINSVDVTATIIYVAFQLERNRCTLLDIKFNDKPKHRKHDDTMAFNHVHEKQNRIFVVVLRKKVYVFQ